MIKKKIILVVLTAIMVFGLATAASAAPWKNKAQGNKWKFKQPRTVKTNVQLVDVNSHWAGQYIRSMASWGMVSGYEDSTFRPDTTVSKFEALMMIARASGYEADKNLSWSDTLKDMTDYVVDEGILTEDESEDLVGWQPAKRYEVAVWAVRAMGLDEDDDNLIFSDSNEIPAYARPYVSSMYRCQYMVGYPGKIFAPNKPVTRAELAAIIYKILEQGPADGNDNDDSDTGVEVKISSLSPADGSDNVDIDTDRLTAKFNVDIEAVDTLDDVQDGIEIESEDGNAVDIDKVSIDGSYLMIYLDDELEEDTTYQVKIDDGIIKAEDSDEVFDGLSGSQWEFNTGNNIEVKISSLSPADGSDNVDIDTDRLTAKFNVDIEAVDTLDDVQDGIEIESEDGNAVDIDRVSIDGSYLMIYLDDELEEDATYKVIIDDDIIRAQDSGEVFKGLSGSQWEFNTGDNTEVKIESLDPQNGADDVEWEGTKILRAVFNCDLEGSNLLDAVKVYNKDEDKEVAIDTVQIDGDELVITLENELDNSDAYEVTIKDGYLKSEDTGVEFGGIDGEDWSFTTR